MTLDRPVRDTFDIMYWGEAFFITSLLDEEEEEEVVAGSVLLRAYYEPRDVSDDWWRNVVPRYTEEQFRRKFRMNRRAVAGFTEMVQLAESANYQPKGPGGRPGLPASLKLCVTLYYLSRVIIIEDCGDQSHQH